MEAYTHTIVKLTLLVLVSIYSGKLITFSCIRIPFLVTFFLLRQALRHNNIILCNIIVQAVSIEPFFNVAYFNEYTCKTVDYHYQLPPGEVYTSDKIFNKLKTFQIFIFKQKENKNIFILHFQVYDTLT